jgi:hypothetical protein
LVKLFIVPEGSGMGPCLVLVFVDV